MRSFVLLAALALAACADPHAPLGANFGSAVRTNIAAQVVDPRPSLAGISEMSGERVDSAISRYDTNSVYRPRLPLAGGQIYDSGPASQQ